MAAFDLRSASLHLSQYIETSRSYQNTKTLLHFYDPMVIIVAPVKMAPDGMSGVSELVDKYFPSNRKVLYYFTSFLYCLLNYSKYRLCFFFFIFYIFVVNNIFFSQVTMARGCFDDTKV